METTIAWLHYIGTYLKYKEEEYLPENVHSKKELVLVTSIFDARSAHYSAV